MANSTPADACRPMDAATHSDSPIDVTDAIADDTVADVTDATTANDRQRWCTGDTATPAFVGSPDPEVRILLYIRVFRKRNFHFFL